MIGIINGIKSLENKLDDARLKYIENNTSQGDEYLQITNILSAAFNNASEEVTQDMLSCKKDNDYRRKFYHVCI